MLLNICVFMIHTDLQDLKCPFFADCIKVSICNIVHCLTHKLTHVFIRDQLMKVR